VWIIGAVANNSDGINSPSESFYEYILHGIPSSVGQASRNGTLLCNVTADDPEGDRE
jgi:hypothetical protein